MLNCFSVVEFQIKTAILTRPFKSELVLDEKICEANLRAYHVGFDQSKFRLNELVDVIRKVIPEFSLGYYEGRSIPQNEVVEKLREAAAKVYLTDKYQRRGEFGELILHLLLRDFCSTIPLISKIYFKDSPNHNVHGFDAIQVSVNGDEKKLWLGESKLYKDGKSGVIELAKDFVEHVNSDYLRQEFSLINNKLHSDAPEIEYWRELIHKHQTLDKIFSSIVIPMVCTYTSNLFVNHSDNCTAYIDDFKLECENMLSTFQDKLNNPNNIDVVLMLLPVSSKDDLNTELDKRLKSMQLI